MKTSEKYPLPTSAECHAKPASLVSVRDLAEFEMVYEAGVDIVDLKEPRSGALAPTDYETWSSVSGFFDGREKQKAGLINGSAPLLSAALGEKKEDFAVAGGLPSIFDFAKAGPLQNRRWTANHQQPHRPLSFLPKQLTATVLNH